MEYCPAAGKLSPEALPQSLEKLLFEGGIEYPLYGLNAL
jgi:hypothetical protein